MNYYLYEYIKPERAVKGRVDSIASKFDVTVSSAIEGANINSSVYLNIYGLSSLLSEFPGNCSSLILSSIEKFMAYPNHLEKFVECSIAICINLKYAGLYITGVNEAMRKLLEEKYGFKCVAEYTNYHSNKMNFFLLKEIPEE